MAKVVEEQKDIFRDDFEKDVTMEHLSKMKYLECCVKEGLRLYPSVPIVGRDIEHDTIIDGQHVPKGTSVLIGRYISCAISRNFCYKNNEKYNLLPYC